MFKKFYLNEDYSFNHKGDLRIKGKDVVWDKEKIDVIINGISYSFDLKWFWLITHYEVFLNIEDLLKINFIENKSRVINLTCGYMMVVNKPIYLDKNFRLIPGYPNFAINNKGEVKTFRCKRRIILKERIGPYGYPCVSIYNPDKSAWRNASVHILLAKAFIINSNPYENFYINHIDGNKLNYNLRNLEWCSSRENIIHAFENGLRCDNDPCKVRDIETGNISNFSSISSALKSIGIDSHKHISKNINNVIVPELFLKRYEIKLIDDNTDWFYNKLNCYKKHVNVGPFQALRLKDNFVLETQTIIELSILTNVSRYKIEGRLRSSKPFSSDGYLFRVKSNLSWPSEYSVTQYTPARCFEIFNFKTNEKRRFNSSRQLRTFLGIDKKTLKNRLATNKPYKDWNISEL